jgi:dienelactone hydrolase
VLSLPDGVREAIGHGAAEVGHAFERIGRHGQVRVRDRYPAGVRGVIALAGLVVAVLAGCGGGDARDEGPFTYDASQPLGFVDRGVVDPDYPLAVHDVSYTSGDNRVDAYLVVPPGDGPWPAAVYVHGAGSDRTSMLGPATWLAARGAITLAISAPSGSAGEPGGATDVERLQAHRALEVGDVVAVRRAIDLLSARDDVDTDRIGYIGWSAGARTGSILAGVEPRLHALVLVAPGSAPVSDFVAAAPAEEKKAVRDVMSSIDPLAYISRGKADRLLIQEATNDQVIPRSAIDAMIAAAPKGTEVRWYDFDHTMGPKAYAEHLEWLQEKLGIDGPPIPGAQTGPQG